MPLHSSVQVPVDTSPKLKRVGSLVGTILYVPNDTLT
jgi:hypothetical protein